MSRHCNDSTGLPESFILALYTYQLKVLITDFITIRKFPKQLSNRSRYNYALELHNTGLMDIHLVVVVSMIPNSSRFHTEWGVVICENHNNIHYSTRMT